MPVNVLLPQGVEAPLHERLEFFVTRLAAKETSDWDRGRAQKLNGSGGRGSVTAPSWRVTERRWSAPMDASISSAVIQAESRYRASEL
jgi:hypothetical protein